MGNVAMEIINEVCDTCGKKHRLMIKRHGMVFGDRQCFLDFCSSIWLQWETEEFAARGLITKKDPLAAESGYHKALEKSGILFLGRANSK
jgi:hypothetical protein